MKKLFLTVSILAVTLGGTAGTATAHQDFSKMTLNEVQHYQLRVIRHARTVVRFWKHHPRIYASHWRFASRDAKFHRQQIKWTKRELEETRSKLRPPETVYHGSTSAWLCIHRYEGPWNANTGNGYYGGLQMDYAFMSSYGGRYLSQYGTADHWTPAQQMEVAERARLSGRGYFPWPNTARACGLI